METTVYLKVKLKIKCTPDTTVEEVLADMHYSFNSQTIGGEVVDSEILEQEDKDGNTL